MGWVFRRGLSLCVVSTLRISRTMSTLEDFLVPPEAVRGSKVLDRAAFSREYQVPAIRLADPRLCSSFLKRLAHACLRFPSLKGVQTELGEDGKEVAKVLLLTPSHLMKTPLLPVDRDWITAHGGEEITWVVRLGYEHFSKRTILRAILPADVKEVPVGFEFVGHIAHYNLKEEHLSYKNIIGQVTLDKQPMLRTVVNKTDQIDSTFRFFKMEVLAGEQDLVATVKENGCTFTFDFSSVYWNSRLGEEHWRVVEMMGKGDVVVDMFAGVGPFAVLAAKNKCCVVYANDLNPHSYKFLVQNARANHVSSQVRAYNLDGREFLCTITKQLLEEALSSPPGVEARSACAHVIMNLPASSVEFLDVFQGLFGDVPEGLRSSFKLPLVHCYCFVKTDSEQEQEACALQQVTANLGSVDLCSEDCVVEVVRSVAPNKVMVRISFKLPPEVAYMDKREEGRDKREEREEGRDKREEREERCGKGEERGEGCGKGEEREEGCGKGEEREEGCGKGEEREEGCGKQKEQEEKHRRQGHRTKETSCSQGSEGGGAHGNQQAQSLQAKESGVHEGEPPAKLIKLSKLEFNV